MRHHGFLKLLVWNSQKKFPKAEVQCGEEKIGALESQGLVFKSDSGRCSVINVSFLTLVPSQNCPTAKEIR